MHNANARHRQQLCVRYGGAGRTEQSTRTAGYNTMTISVVDNRPLPCSWAILLFAAAASAVAQAGSSPGSTRNVFTPRSSFVVGAGKLKCRAALALHVKGGAFEPSGAVTDEALKGDDVKKKVKRKQGQEEVPVVATAKPKDKPMKEKKRPIKGGRESACLRRIKREWKDAVELGVAYDWVKGVTVARKEVKGTLKPAADANVDPKRYNYVRMGPMKRNLLHWHFSVQGAPNSVYEQGVYHGRIILPKDYPLSPPRVQMLTPSGRFICGHDICLSASSFHPESWTPRWTILSLIDALRLHMLTSANEIGGQRASNEQRRKRALESRTWGRGIVSHEEMITEGIFRLGSTEDEDQVGDENGEEGVENQSESLPTPPTPEEILDLVTAEAVRRHGERSVEAAQVPVARSRSKPMLLVAKFIFYSFLLLLHGIVSVLKSPIKIALMAFMLIFAYVNSRRA